MARLCRRAEYLCSTYMAIAHLRSTYITVCMPVHLYQSTALDAFAPWLPEGGEAAHTHTALDWPNTRGCYQRSRVAVRSFTPRVAVHSGMHGVESACSNMLSHSPPSVSTDSKRNNVRACGCSGRCHPDVISAESAPRLQ